MYRLTEYTTNDTTGPKKESTAPKAESSTRGGKDFHIDTEKLDAANRAKSIKNRFTSLIKQAKPAYEKAKAYYDFYDATRNDEQKSAYEAEFDELKKTLSELQDLSNLLQR